QVVVVLDLHVIAQLAVVFHADIVPPAAVPGRGGELGVVVFRLAGAILVLEGHVDRALPAHVADQRLGPQDLVDAVEGHGTGSLAVGKRDMALLGALQGARHLAFVLILLDHQRLVAFQGGHAGPADRHLARIGSLQHQLAPIERLDGAGQTSTEPFQLMSRTSGLGRRIWWMLSRDTVRGRSPLASVTWPSSALCRERATSPSY